MSPKQDQRRKQIGKLPPRYIFFLNPYVDARFTRCPQCDRKMQQRKLPLYIHVFPNYPVSVNFTCRYCTKCDLLIAHKDRLEDVLARLFILHGQQDMIGNDYLVVGTVERSDWRPGELSLQHILDNLHDFKQVVIFELERGGWQR